MKEQMKVKVADMSKEEFRQLIQTLQEVAKYNK